MNKKGFLKIMEAIIAIIIVLGFVINIIPVNEKNPSNVPPDLKQTTDSILSELQNNAKFRNCVLGGETNYDFENTGRGESKVGIACINAYIELNTYPSNLHPWKYAMKVCSFNSEGMEIGCDYLADGERLNPDK